jgi:hypothetical protein
VEGRADMCKSTMDNSVETPLNDLSSKAEELSSMSTQEMVDMCQEMLDNIYNRCDEWSHAGNWTTEWAKVDELRSDDSSSSHVGQVMASITRFLLGDYLSKFLETYSISLKTTLDGPNKPELLKKVRTLTENQTEFSVYGPVGLPFPGHEFEVWARSKPEGYEEETSSFDKPELGPVALVLGAGNQAFLSVVDVVECVFMKRKPVLFKHHPLRPFLMEACKILFVSYFQFQSFGNAPPAFESRIKNFSC